MRRDNESDQGTEVGRVTCTHCGGLVHRTREFESILWRCLICGRTMKEVIVLHGTGSGAQTPNHQPRRPKHPSRYQRNDDKIGTKHE